MSLPRLPPFAQIFRPAPEDVEGTEELIDGGSLPTPAGRSSAAFDPSAPPPKPAPRGESLGGLLLSVSSEDVRTKPSYTDCWITNPPDGLRPLASYMTDCGSVLVGTSDDGEIEYNVTPREYAYPDSLNKLVMDVIEEIRESYRSRGGRLDRESVMGTARSILTDRYADLEAISGPGDLDRVVADVCSIAYRHSVGAGIFEVLLTDPHIEDVYIDAPASRNRVHVTMNGISGLNSHIRCRTNLMVEDREVDNLVNILRRESGLRFCRSNPVLETDFKEFDARVTVIGYPMSPNGNALAIRKHSVRPWTLSRLISNGTIDARTAGILSYLVNNRTTILVCGARGAGKSSLLSALMFEFPLSQRILTIEDTIELPGDELRRNGFKIQSMLLDSKPGRDQLSRAEEALRVSLRMGESAIVLGEVRGDEARTLYQSMRAGRAGSAIMGTIHGDSAESVFKRVVYDMGISPEAFMATDVIVTLGTVKDRRTGHLIRKVSEIVSTGAEPGEFVAITDPDTMFDSPVMARALRTSQSGRRQAVKEIRARSMMRAYLAEKGTEDDRFLGPEWIVAANETLALMRPDSSAESALDEFRRRIEEAVG